MLQFQGLARARAVPDRFSVGGSPPVRRALISDIHGNLEALEVVLDDIKAQGITEIFCLGDIIGYGPNPRECIDRVMETCKVTLLGNHDQGAMFDPDGFNIGAERAIFWTREQLESPSRSRQQSAPLGVPGRTAPVAPVRSVPFRPRLAAQSAERIHLPRRHLQSSQDGTAVPACGRVIVFRGIPMSRASSPRISSSSPPRRSTWNTRLGEGKLMVNVGSVGQPRDGDNRACYVVLEDGLADDSRQRRRPIGRRWLVRRRSSTGVCLTTLRPRSRRSTPFPSSNRSWAIGSGKDDRLVCLSSRARRPAGSIVQSLDRASPADVFFPPCRPVTPERRTDVGLQAPVRFAIDGLIGANRRVIRPAAASNRRPEPASLRCQGCLTMS